MSLSAGTRLGPYEILAPLGAGGMGEVYSTRDPRMGREVAINGPNYLVMELVDGTR
jgi:serine/threonine protein kinase